MMDEHEVPSVATAPSNNSAKKIAAIALVGIAVAVILWQMQPKAKEQAKETPAPVPYSVPGLDLILPEPKEVTASQPVSVAEKPAVWNKWEAETTSQKSREEQARRGALSIVFNGQIQTADKLSAKPDRYSQHVAGREKVNQNSQSEDNLESRLGEVPARRYAAFSVDRAYLLGLGKTLPCTLEGAIQSDLPGMTRCIINHDVYSEDGSHLLIPRGSKAIGEYRGGLQRGMSRIFVIWTRLRTPQGLDIELASPGTGELGAAGYLADIDGHFLERFGSSALLSIIGGLAATNSTGVDSYGATATAFSRSAEIALENSIGIRPTGSVAQGSKVIIMVAQDISFSAALRAAR